MDFTLMNAAAPSRFQIINGPILFQYKDTGSIPPGRLVLRTGNRVIRLRSCAEGSVNNRIASCIFTTSGGLKWFRLYSESENKPPRHLWSGLIWNMNPKPFGNQKSEITFLHPPKFLPPSPPKSPAVVAIIHLHYLDLWDELAAYVSQIPEEFDLLVTTPKERYQQASELVHSLIPHATLIPCENRGRDILPFLKALEVIHSSKNKYEFICKIHSKKSPHRWDGTHWRRTLINDLLGSPEIVHAHLEHFRNDSHLGLIAPWDNLSLYSSLPGEVATQQGVKNLQSRMDAESISHFPFPKGSMFWARMSALKPLLSAQILPEEFAAESGQMDGTIAHAIERVFGLSAMKAGYTCEEAPEIPSSDC